MVIPSVLEYAHTLAGRGVNKGGVAIDATVGNGHDTLFLAQAVGPHGSVIGFDIQEEALESTRRRVETEAPEASLRLFHAGHEMLKEHLDESVHGKVGAVMFNLGYLPGGDHSITTTPETTRQALDASTHLLRPGGIVTVVAYPGHDGGAEEAKAVHSWMSVRSQETYRVLSYQFPNQPADAPGLFAFERRR